MAAARQPNAIAELLWQYRRSYGAGVLENEYPAEMPDYRLVAPESITKSCLVTTWELREDLDRFRSLTDDDEVSSSAYERVVWTVTGINPETGLTTLNRGGGAGPDDGIRPHRSFEAAEWKEAWADGEVGLWAPQLGEVVLCYNSCSKATKSSPSIVQVVDYPQTVPDPCLKATDKDGPDRFAQQVSTRLPMGHEHSSSGPARRVEAERHSRVIATSDNVHPQSIRDMTTGDRARSSSQRVSSRPMQQAAAASETTAMLGVSPVHTSISKPAVPTVKGDYGALCTRTLADYQEKGVRLDRDQLNSLWRREEQKRGLGNVVGGGWAFDVRPTERRVATGGAMGLQADMPPPAPRGLDNRVAATKDTVDLVGDIGTDPRTTIQVGGVSQRAVANQQAITDQERELAYWKEQHASQSEAIAGLTQKVDMVQVALEDKVKDVRDAERAARQIMGQELVKTMAQAREEKTSSNIPLPRRVVGSAGPGVVTLSSKVQGDVPLFRSDGNLQLPSGATVGTDVTDDAVKYLALVTEELWEQLKRDFVKRFPEDQRCARAVDACRRLRLAPGTRIRAFVEELKVLHKRSLSSIERAEPAVRMAGFMRLLWNTLSLSATDAGSSAFSRRVGILTNVVRAKEKILQRTQSVDLDTDALGALLEDKEEEFVNENYLESWESLLVAETEGRQQGKGRRREILGGNAADTLSSPSSATDANVGMGSNATPGAPPGPNGQDVQRQTNQANQQLADVHSRINTLVSMMH
ncbi:hypothetical protein JKP88DRAFT_316946 [Tribonema minus]|uniref:Retrotransposon gag domain-containing protein n=1 Tax=Tribonema minus TaxID=303371 RepID=A0A836CF03_9STRA|nr:hypothetical protein JKP88DRAFT_316946 [Tribonema minus]